MVELEILFSSGQGILVPMEDREAALQLMQRAMDYQIESQPHLFHLSTPYEEILIDVADVSFIRLKKENYPRLGAIKISASSSFNGFDQQEPAQTQSQSQSQSHQQTQRPPTESDKQRTFTVDPEGHTQDPNAPKTFTVDDHGNVDSDPFSTKFKKAEERLKQAEIQQQKLDAQHQKIRKEIKETAEELEDAVREAELKKKLEDIEISGELKRMKGQKND